MLFAALVPLLPHYRDELGLSKTGVGVVVASYAAGALVGSLPGGMVASRFGPKRAALAGLVLMAAASVAFGLASGEVELILARFAQGVGSALSWAGSLSWLVAATPRDRRGEMLGTAVGAAIFGALLGPVLGAAAGLTSPTAVFSAVGVLGVGLAVWAARTPGTPAEPQPVSQALAALRRSEVGVAMWLMILPSVLFGVLAVLTPLKLDDAGWGATAIGAVFLVAAALEMVISPVIGRVSDRIGRHAPLRLSVIASVVVSLALAWSSAPVLVAVLVVLAGSAYGSFWAPAMALLTDAADRIGLAQALAFGLINLAWAGGNVIGPAVSGSLADAAGDAAPFVLAAVICLGTAFFLGVARVPGTPSVRVPEES
jgi:MFS family permease